MLESTDSKQVASSHIALAAHKTVNPLQKLQDNLRGGPSWQPQPSQAEHSLRGAPLVSAEKQQDLSPPGGGTAQPDASRFMPSIQPPPPASVGAAAVPGVGFEGIQSTLSTMAPPLHVGAAPQHVAAAIEETCQPAQSRGGAPDMGRLAASRPLPQRPVESKQPAAAQVLQQRAPSPDGSAQPGQWRTKHRTAAQPHCSMKAACAAPLQHMQGACCAEDGTKLVQDSAQAQHACAAEGAAAMPGSSAGRQCAVEDTLQAEDSPPWLSEQVIARAK